MSELYGHECYAPQEIAEKVETVGVAKANLPLASTVALGILAGAFIGLGAMFCNLVLGDPRLGFAVGRLLGGLVFSMGLILVVIAGAELFTGNNLLVMAFVARRITGRKLATNLAVVFVANLLGAFGLALLVSASGHPAMANGGVGRAAVLAAAGKAALPFWEAFLRGVLCNLLVCLAVWLAMAGRSVTDKVVAIVFPITAFVAAGFEHSVANMYVIPLGMLLQAHHAVAEPISAFDFARNLVPVTLGNLVGGAGLVGLVYHRIYRCSASSIDDPARPQMPAPSLPSASAAQSRF